MPTVNNRIINILVIWPLFNASREAGIEYTHRCSTVSTQTIHKLFAPNTNIFGLYKHALRYIQCNAIIEKDGIYLLQSSKVQLTFPDNSNLKMVVTSHLQRFLNSGLVLLLRDMPSTNICFSTRKSFLFSFAENCASWINTEIIVSNKLNVTKYTQFSSESISASWSLKGAIFFRLRLCFLNDILKIIPNTLFHLSKSQLFLVFRIGTG